LSAILALYTAPALACINDGDSYNTEQQFQQQYEPQDYKPAAPQKSPVVLAGMGAGAMLLIGSLAFSLFRGRATGGNRADEIV